MAPWTRRPSNLLAVVAAAAAVSLAGCAADEPAAVDPSEPDAASPTSTTDTSSTASPTVSIAPNIPPDPSAGASTPLPNSDLANTLALLPLPAGAAPRGAPVAEGDTIQQTFRVQGDGPAALLEQAFTEQLATEGWELTEDVEPRGDGAAATWIRDDLELQLVSQAGPDGDEVVLNVLVTTRS